MSLTQPTHPWSRFAQLGSWLVLVGLALFYYPKWQYGGGEATLSWDVAGYYWYLPAFLIYDDAKTQAFAPDITARYRPCEEDFQQAFQHESGVYVMKYSMGRALSMLPFFGVAHAIASASDTYPADGFSRPYQLAITIEFLLIALLGLWALRRWLLRFVGDGVAAITLLLIALGTNYTEYAGINGGMAHGNLFTIYGLILLLSARYGERPGYLPALGIGALVGLAALTRPTEIFSALIPLGWAGLTLLQQPRSRRWSTLRPHLPALLLAGICVGLIGSLQLVYWHWATGDWIVYSYQDQGFNWLSPYIKNCLIGFRAGWWVYTPLMVFPFLGFGLYWKKAPALAGASLAFLLLFMYVAFAWRIWWYGGSLGQRTMISTYPVLAVPLALLIGWLGRQRLPLRLVVGALMLLAAVNSLYWVHQAHRGGLLMAGNMKHAYFWHTLGRFEQTPKGLRLMDTSEIFEGERADIRLLWSAPADSLEPLPPCDLPGDLAERLHHLYVGGLPICPMVAVPLEPQAGMWVRASLSFQLPQPITRPWNMRKVMLVLRYQGELVKETYLRLDRHASAGELVEQYLDIELPDKRPVDEVAVLLHNPEATISVMNLRLESFRGE
jgi:hypothetical protein